MKKQFKVLFFMFLTAFIFSLSLLGRQVTAAAAQSTVLKETGDNVQAEDSLSSVKLNVQKKSMVTGTTYQLKLYNMGEAHKASFKSSDSDVVSVTEYGLLTANKSASDQDDAQRTATISVTVRDSETGKSVTLTCDVTVGPRAESVKFICADTLYLKVGEKRTPSVSVKPKNSTDQPVLISTNPSVVKVSSSGRITAKSEGTATIIAMATASGKFSSITVVVTAADDKEEESKDGNVTTGSAVSSLVPALNSTK